jgi:hypothetical protein
MLTIKFVSTTGRETIASVVSVEFDPKKDELVGYGPNGSGSLRYSGGKAFVMNENGKTISVYSLRSKKYEEAEAEVITK